MLFRFLDRLSSVPMIVRAVAALVLTCALTCGVASAASPKQRPQAPKSPEEPMTFYVVKGASDACGRGCDTWIEAEGKVEADTAARLKEISGSPSRSQPADLLRLAGRQSRPGHRDGEHASRQVRPLPGWGEPRCGNVALRRRTATSASSSSNPAANSTAISSPAVRSAPRPVLMFLMGAAVHEVAPDAILAIHSPKVILNFPRRPAGGLRDRRRRTSAVASVPIASPRPTSPKWGSTPDCSPSPGPSSSKTFTS